MVTPEILLTEEQRFEFTQIPQNISDFILTAGLITQLRQCQCIPKSEIKIRNIASDININHKIIIIIVG
jgi:hypothetical protein